MANPEHLKILQKGVNTWNAWRKANREVQPDLQGVDLHGLNLSACNFKLAKMQYVNLAHSNLTKANLTNAFFRHANFTQAQLIEANLSGANLRHAVLYKTILTKANLRRADLSYADLSYALMTECILEYTRIVDNNLDSTIFDNSYIYGASVWNVKGVPKSQSNLTITPHIARREQSGSIITVDDLEVAQFIYLLLNNKKIRNLIDTITSKVVLILGRFTDERKNVLDTLSNALRQRNYLPIIFDFTGSERRDITETISTLAHMAKFIIADITDARSIPQELMAIVPNLPSVPVQPLLLSSHKEYSMFEYFRRYPWVLEIFQYDNTENLIHSIWERVIIPAETYLANIKY